MLFRRLKGQAGKIKRLGLAVSRVRGNDAELLLVLVGDLEITVHIGIAEKLDKAAGNGRFKANLDRGRASRNLGVSTRKLEAEEITGTPIFGCFAGGNIFQRAGDLIAGNAYAGLVSAYFLTCDCGVTAFGGNGNTYEGFEVPSISPTTIPSSLSGKKVTPDITRSFTQA